MVVRNREPKGLGSIVLDRLPWKKSILPNHPIFPGLDALGGDPSTARDDVAKVEFRLEEGVVEIRDPRLFRDGREHFCLALVDEIVRPGLAQRVEIHFGPATCRFEFELGRYDHDELAKKIASALKAATQTSRVRQAPLDRDRRKWITLTAVASNEGPSIVETLLEIPQPLAPKPRAARSSQPPKPVDPLALAFSETAIFAQSPAGDSRRMAALALAGGSFAMAIAGVILPGIPALPFLLLTGHYLVRSSPTLCRRLERVPGIGSLLKKAGEIGGQTVDFKSIGKMVGLTVAALAAFLILNPPLPLVILLETAIIAYYGFRQFQKPGRVVLAANLGPGVACLA